MTAPPDPVADRLAEALRELKRELDSGEAIEHEFGNGDPENQPYVVLSARTERLVADALRAYDGNST